MNKKVNHIDKIMGADDGAIFMASTLGVFVILSLFSLYLLRFIINENRDMGHYIMDIKARNLALSGMERGLQQYRSTRSPATIQGTFNTGNYNITYDTLRNESQSNLPYTNYVCMKSRATIDNVERNVRLYLSSFPEAFCMSFYGNNEGSTTFSPAQGSITGPIFFRGDISTTIVNPTNTKYTSTGNGGILLSSSPPFPSLSTTDYEALLNSINYSHSGSSYNNFALSFDRVNDYVKINNTNDINLGTHTQRTIEAWFKVDNKDLSAKQVIYEEGAHIRGLNIYIYSGSLYLGGWNEPNNESNWEGTWLSTAGIQNNTWYHVALTLNGGNSVSNNALKGYLNGVEFGSGTGSKLWAHSGDITIGRNGGTKFLQGGDNTSVGEYFGGDIDEIRIWNIARSQAQLSAMKDTVLSGNESGLVAYLNLQENSGSTANDQTSENNDGTIYGATWTYGPFVYTYNGQTINLSQYSDSTFRFNGDLTLTNSTVTGTGYFAVKGNLTIGSSTSFNSKITVVSSGNISISSSQLGANIRKPVIVYCKGTCTFSNSSTFYGLLISKGSSLSISGSTINGAILNYSQTFQLNNSTNIVGSVVSDYSIQFQDSNSTITKGGLPPFFGVNTGLVPMVVPGTYLEY